MTSTWNPEKKFKVRVIEVGIYTYTAEGTSVEDIRWQYEQGLHEFITKEIEVPFEAVLEIKEEA